MVIVNPYAKKKKPAPSSGTGIRSSSSRPMSGNPSNRKGPINSAPRRPIASNPSGFNAGRPQSQPSRVTPNGKKPLVSNAVANRPRVATPSSAQKGTVSSVTPNKVNSSAAPRPIHGKPFATKRKMSVKQRLKQEIAALKKQKQLQKLQKETDERRRKRMAEKKAEEARRMAFLAAKEAERRQKQLERERLAVLKQEERIRKQQERERKQREKELEKERKIQEKARREEEKRVRLEQQMEERKQKAEEKYQRDLQAWKKHQQRWIEQQQRIHFFQQQRLQQQAQWNYQIAGQHQMSSNVMVHQQPQLQNQTPLKSPLPSVKPTTLRLPPTPSNENQQQNREEVPRTAGSAPGTPAPKTPSTPLSPLDSSTALALDTLMQSDLFSSPSKSETTDVSDSEKLPSPVPVLTSKSVSTSEDNKDSVRIDDQDVEMSIADDKKSQADKSEDSAGTKTESPSDKLEQPVQSTDIQKGPAESKKESPSGPETVATNDLAPVVPTTTSSPSVNLDKLTNQTSQQADKSLEPTPISSAQITLPQKSDSQQLSRPAVPPAVNQQFASYAGMGYGSMFQNRIMPMQTLSGPSHFNPMMNNGFMNAGHFALPGYMTWVPPPPPPPLPPIFSQAKAPRRTSSVTKRPKAPKPSAPALLCNSMEAPSPFASQGRYLVTVVVVRDPRTEKSFGVNLQLHMESALVDPEWLEAQKAKEKPKVKDVQKPALMVKVETEKPSTNNGTTATLPSQDPQPTTPSPDLVVSQKPVANTNQSPVMAPTEAKDSEVKSEAPAPIISQADPESKSTSEATDNSIQNPPSNITVAGESNDRTKEIVKKCLEDLVNAVVVKAASGDGKSPRNIQRRKRRRRVNFAVMQVMDANKQNSRRPDADDEEKLQPGDIVVSVQDHVLNGMSFKEACGVFSQKAENVSDSLIQTKVVVARKRAVVAPPVIVPTSETKTPVLPTSTAAPTSAATPATNTAPIIAEKLPDNTSMVFSPAEIASLSHSFFQTLHSSSRVLGLDIQDSAWKFHSVIFRMGLLLKDTELTPRTYVTLKDKWSHLTRLIDYNLVEKGKTFWTKKLLEEFGDEKIPFSSDVERHARRHLPRPSTGCRCGKKDHEYVFDPKCTLYRDLQNRLPKDELAALRQQKKKKSSLSDKDLNKVESAFKNRMIKLKTATENESIEARFVEKMEEIQVKELHKAVFAPNLATIVLSTIFELQREFRVSAEDEERDNDDDEEDEEDDLALDSLGKRKTEDEPENEAKKQHKVGREEDPNISLKYLIRMLEYASKTWGHCYREPDRDEYAWRWELFHAVHSNYDQWDAHATNPRVPGSFTFENIRFGLSSSKVTNDEVSSLPKAIRKFEDSIVSSSHSSFDARNEILDEFCMLIHLLSPARSGLYDEMIALLKMGVFKVSPSGIPVLTEDWWTKIDIVVLDDMHTSWSTKIDPESRHCVNDELRDTLEEKWVWKRTGWSLAENPSELVFDFAILDEWRETFEGRIEEKENMLEGIGRFGL